MMPPSFFSSSAVRELEGSSIIISLESKDNALVISTICISDALRSPTIAWVSMVLPMESSSSRAFLWVPFIPFVSEKRPRKIFSPTVILLTRLNSW